MQVDLDFQRFATVKPEFRGERIAYGITIPSNAPHPEEAALFIAFLLGPEGQAVHGSRQSSRCSIPALADRTMNCCRPRCRPLTVPLETP